MRIDPDVIEASRPDDREIALLAAEVRRLQAVINSEESTLTDEEREAIEASREFWQVEADCWPDDDTDRHDRRYASVLRALLERLT